MATKRPLQHLQRDTAQCLEETQPAMKRLRLSSSEPDLDEVSLRHQDQVSRLQEVAVQTTPQQHMLVSDSTSSSSTYMAMNALLKQLHLERLQRLQPVSNYVQDVMLGS